MLTRKHRILIVDKKTNVNDNLLKMLKRNNFFTELCENNSSALTKLKTELYDLVITELSASKIDGLEIIRTVKELDINLGVIVITADGTVENAVAAMKEGAFDYITKPFTTEQLEIAIDKYFEFKKLIDENSYLKNELKKTHIFDHIIGKSERMLKVFEAVETVAESCATVLIQGESGTGKELIARAIHEASPRKQGPFIKTNCAALPETLAESELFGHIKGAFTGAVKDTPGRFEKADGGTLLLDEISEMSLTMQAKLLRVLQEKEFEKVGCPESMQVDVRIIATTNKDLKREVTLGNFREDLYFRLHVFPIQLPSLNERKEDIPLLAEHFLLKYAHENKKNIFGFSDEVIDAFMSYNWHGNVRELKNMIERAVVFAKDTILKPKDFQFLENSEDPKITIVNFQQATLEDIEKFQILRVLQECNGNKTQAASKLGISTRTLRNKLKKYRECE